MAKENYEVYADHGLSHQFLVRQLSILDTGTAPNLIKSDLIPPVLRAHNQECLALDIGAANKYLLKTVGNLPLSIRFGNCVVQLSLWFGTHWLLQ